MVAWTRAVMGEWMSRIWVLKINEGKLGFANRLGIWVRSSVRMPLRFSFWVNPKMKRVIRQWLTIKLEMYFIVEDYREDWGGKRQFRTDLKNELLWITFTLCSQLTDKQETLKGDFQKCTSWIQSHRRLSCVIENSTKIRPYSLSFSFLRISCLTQPEGRTFVTNHHHTETYIVHEWRLVS